MKEGGYKILMYYLYIFCFHFRGWCCVSVLMYTIIYLEAYWLLKKQCGLVLIKEEIMQFALYFINETLNLNADLWTDTSGFALKHSPLWSALKDWWIITHPTCLITFFHIFPWKVPETLWFDKHSISEMRVSLKEIVRWVKDRSLFLGPVATLEQIAWWINK